MQKFTLQYVGKQGDVLACEYFNTLEDAETFADDLIETYNYYGVYKTYALFIVDRETGKEDMYWEYTGEIPEDEEEED